MFDAHVHAAPDVLPRIGDDADVLDAYRTAGFTGFVLQGHYESTVGRAHALARRTGLPVVGGITLNQAAGGINPAAAAALGAGGRVVWMPTADAHTQEAAGLPRLRDADERLERRVFAVPPIEPAAAAAADLVLALVAEHDAVLATGHLSGGKGAWLLARARHFGIGRVLLTHPSYTVPGLDPARVPELAAASGHVEITAYQLLHQPGCTPQMLAEVARAAGDRLVLSSDSGQPDSPPRRRRCTGSSTSSRARGSIPACCARRPRPCPPSCSCPDRPLIGTLVPPDSFVRTLRAQLAGEVLDDGGTRAAYASDASNHRVVPACVVLPRDTADVVALLERCADAGVPITSRGTGTNVAGNAIAPGVVVDTSRHMRGVLAVDPDTRTAIVEPGVILDDLRAAVAPHGLTFGVAPSTHSRCTLGGMISTNACGSHSLAWGTTADNVDTLEVVLADATTATLCRGPSGLPMAQRLIVTLEPSCGAALRSDLPDLLDDDRARRVAARIQTLAEMLQDRDLPLDPSSVHTAVTQFHCHQRAVFGTDADRALLARAGSPSAASTTAAAGSPATSVSKTATTTCRWPAPSSRSSHTCARNPPRRYSPTASPAGYRSRSWANDGPCTSPSSSGVGCAMGGGEYTRTDRDQNDGHGLAPVRPPGAGTTRETKEVRHTWHPVRKLFTSSSLNSTTTIYRPKWWHKPRVACWI